MAWGGPSGGLFGAGWVPLRPGVGLGWRPRVVCGWFWARFLGPFSRYQIGPFGILKLGVPLAPGCKYAVKWEESMNTVVCQELTKFNRLLSVIRKSLENIKKAVKGLIVMSADLDALSSSLIFAQIPAMWKAKSYPSLKPLAGYVSDLIERCSFFGDWLNDKPPAVYWISGFFFTQAFLTGSKQNFARKKTIPIDAIIFDYAMMPKPTYRNGPREGVYTYGLFFEGAQWDLKAEILAESSPKVVVGEVTWGNGVVCSI